MTATAEKNAHVWQREQHDHYVEPSWAVDLLLERETFPGPVTDPCCGFGTIPEAFERIGQKCTGFDLVDRGYGLPGQNFLAWSRKTIQPSGSIVMNPPYKQAEQFIDQALRFASHKVAVIMPLKFLASAKRHPAFTGRWPTRRVWVLSSRPSMLPGALLKAGQKASGGAIDYCWLVFEHGYEGEPGIGWLVKGGAHV